MADDPIAAVETALGVSFRDRSLLVRALTHRSFLNENPGDAGGDNERLEFLGDAVLDFAVSRILVDQAPEAREGELSRRRAAIVNETRLAEVARAVGIGAALRLGRGEDLTRGREKASLLGDALEATIAAVYLDLGIAAAEGVVERLFSDAFRDAADRDVDYKTRLQEAVQSRHGRVPRYVTVSESGPDHDKVFVVEIRVGEERLGTGEGKSKKSAEQAAAREALERLPPREEDRR